MTGPHALPLSTAHRVASGPARQRGVATLVVVMALFFVLALVAAYTNRNLVYEQRTAANSYRAERALATADGAVDWTLSQLNGGRVALNCGASTTASDGDFRSRYLTLNSQNGGYVTSALMPTCITPHSNTPALRCACPTPTSAGSITVPTDEPATAFRVSFMTPTGMTTTPPGTVYLQVTGCSNVSPGAASCISNDPNPEADARSQVRATLGLVRALPAKPVAPLVVGNDITVPANMLVVTNAETSAVAVHGRSFSTSGATLLFGPDGAAGSNQASSALHALVDAGKFFEAAFGMPAALYKAQPAVVRVACPAGCTMSDAPVVNALTNFPGRTVYIDGDLAFDSVPGSSTVGTTAIPVMLVVNGTLTLTAAVNLTGFVYATEVLWQSGTATLQGALAAAQNFTATTAVTIAYDADVMATITKGYGSFVRVPGGWNRGF